MAIQVMLKYACGCYAPTWICDYGPDVEDICDALSELCPQCEALASDIVEKEIELEIEEWFCDLDNHMENSEPLSTWPNIPDELPF